MAKRSLIIFSILLCVFFAFKASAQVQNGDIVIEANPKNPKINEVVKVSLSTFTTDLNTAKISWILDGKMMLEGIGKKFFSFTFDTSSPRSVEATIETISGSVIVKKITLSPSGVDLLWEATNTYVPPFYKGKKLMPVEGSVKVVAVPSTNNFIGFTYLWKQDGKNKAGASGYEKNYFSYKNTYLEKNNEIEVVASDIFGNSVGSNKILITPSNTKIIFYKKNTAEGVVWGKSLKGSVGVGDDGLNIVAEPYFFSQKDTNSPFLGYKWYLNNQEISTPKEKNTIYTKPEAGTSGYATIKLVINNISTLFQKTEKELDVNF